MATKAWSPAMTSPHRKHFVETQLMKATDRPWPRSSRPESGGEDMEAAELMKTSEHHGRQLAEEHSHGQTGRSTQQIDVPGVVRILKGGVSEAVAQVGVFLEEGSKTVVLTVNDVLEVVEVFVVAMSALHLAHKTGSVDLE